MAVADGAPSVGTKDRLSESAENGQLTELRQQPIVAALDRPDFKTVDFINQIFPNEASLVAVDPLVQKLRDRVRRVDAEILAAVRQQSSSGSKAKEDLSAAMGAIQELSLKIKEIKAKAEESEVMVQEICRDIKKLDFAKKHITTTITALNRLGMLVLAVDRLQVLATHRQYRDAAGQLEAVTQLCGHFEAYSDIPKISELREKFHNIKTTLKSHIFSDFSSLGTAGLKDNGQLMQQLADACLVVDALEPAVREELIRTVCSKELTAYQQIFQGTEVAKLEKAERRYAWIKRQLKVNEEVWRIFPASWRVSYLLCMQFCKITRAQLAEILDGAKEKPDVATLLQALERTLEFEDDLAERFGGGKDPPEAEGGGARDPHADDDHPEAKALRSKYLAQRGPKEGDAEEPKVALTAAAQVRFSFKGTISSVFEPHLGVYVDLEERQLMDALDKLTLDETWEAEEGSQTNILSSSTQMFLRIRKSFNRCSQLTRNQTLFSLYKVFQRVLQAYAGKLSGRLPKPGQGLVAAATGSDWQVKMTDKDERVICYIVNTAEYCHETAAQLAESIQSRIDAQFVESVDMTEEQDEFSGVITRALSILVLGMETKLDAELAGMMRINWAIMESVGDQSDYVNQISAIFSSSVPQVAGLLSPLYFQFFMDKLAASFAPRFYVGVFKCKRISGTGAQQLLLDTHAIKTLLLEVPSLGGQAVPPPYSKYVAREMGKAEALLKVILSPVEAIADTYRALLPEGNASDFQRILDLKGVKKPEQQPLIDHLNRRAAPPAPAPGATPAAAASSSTTLAGAASGAAVAAPAGGLLAVGAAAGPLGTPAVAAGMLSNAASREAMIARATALGRGAMAQSAAAAAAVSSSGALKKIFALAESAKEGAAKKDMTFRKLFNA